MQQYDIKYLNATALLMKLFEAYNIGGFGVASINFEFLVTTDWPLNCVFKSPQLSLIAFESTAKLALFLSAESSCKS